MPQRAEHRVLGESAYTPVNGRFDGGAECERDLLQSDFVNLSKNIKRVSPEILRTAHLYRTELLGIVGT